MRLPPPPDVTRLFLVRHAATAANEMRPYILQGAEIDGPLTATGERQATQLADALKDFRLAAVYASPMQRAQQTAGIVAGPHGLPVVPIPHLKECSVGRWEGLDWETIRQREPDLHDAFFADPVCTPHPGGESYGDVLKRITAPMNEIFARHCGENVVVIAHNMVNRVYLAEFLGIDLKHARRIKQSNCAITVLERRDDKIELITLNSVLHLDAA